jgi:putative phosphoserine phosphatase/1-acylglycerol-3-phosphate O-acyltransferase
VRARTKLEDGLSILRSIADSDAFKEMRERLRDGATRLADDDRIPRLIAGSAGILAALLADSSSEFEAYSNDSGLEPERDEASDQGVSEWDETDDAMPESGASVRDLDDPTLLDEEPPDDDAVLSEEPADDGERLLRFDVDGEDVEAPGAVSHAGKNTSSGDTKPKAAKARTPRSPAAKKPAKKASSKSKAPRASTPQPKTSPKPAKTKAPKSVEVATLKAPRSPGTLPSKTPRARAKKSS